MAVLSQTVDDDSLGTVLTCLSLQVTREFYTEQGISMKPDAALPEGKFDTLLKVIQWQ